MKGGTNKVLISALAALIVIAATTVWYFNFQKPRNIAVKEYQSVVGVIQEKNSQVDEAISPLRTLIDSEEKPLDENIIVTAKELIKNAEVSKILIEDMPNKTEDIITKTQELNKPIDFSDIIRDLKEAYSTLDTSIKQLKQLTNPSEEFVIQRLQTIDDISDARPVTEDNDPNGKLNKAGGYTATVYFESKNINQNNVYGNDLIDKGTDAGGAIEVYANEEDAIKRNDYLAAFDGGILSSGSHRVVGTVVIRTSDELTASQQKALEEKVLNALSALQ